MASDPERPARGRRRVAARRGAAPTARRTAPERAGRVDPGWEALLARPDTPAEDAVADAPPAPSPAPPVPPAPDDVDPTEEQRAVVVATTPGVPAARLAASLTPAAPPATSRSAAVAAPTSRTAASRAAANRTAAGRAVPRAAASTPATPGPEAGGPDPSSEFGRMFSRVLVRMGAVERRLDAFEQRIPAGSGDAAAPVPVPDPAVQEAEREYDRQMLTWLGDRVEAMTAQIEDQRRQAEGHTEAVDGALNQTESLSLALARVQAQVNELAAANGNPNDTRPCAEHQLLAPTVAELQQATAAAGDRALALEARVAQLETLPSVMEDVAAHQFRRLAAELPSAAVDLEGVYKELDSVAEVVAARDAAVAKGLEELGSLDATVATVYSDFVRIVEALAASQAAEEEVHERLAAIERRLEMLESPEYQVERLSSALDRTRTRAPEAARPVAVEPTGIRVADGAGFAEPGTAPATQAPGTPPQQSIQMLAADLDRIRRSLEVLAAEAPPSD